jgi:hypothetical protein
LLDITVNLGVDHKGDAMTRAIRRVEVKLR